MLYPSTISSHDICTSDIKFLLIPLIICALFHHDSGYFRRVIRLSLTEFKISFCIYQHNFVIIQGIEIENDYQS